MRSAFNGSTEIVRARYLQAMRPCPILVNVRNAGREVSVVLRIARNDGGVDREAAIYPVLKQLGLPVPTVLAGPRRDPDEPGLYAMTVMEKLPGEPLSVWAMRPEGGLKVASDMLRHAYRCLQATTGHAMTVPELAGLPRRSIQDDLHEVIRRSDSWMELAEIREAVNRISKALEETDTSLMLSNGDFAPANFLSDGLRLTGMLDFEKAGFVDPLGVLTRFPVYDYRSLLETGFIDALLRELGYTQRDFAPRVAVFCLRTLQTKLPVEGGAPAQQDFRRHVLTVLEGAMKYLA